jgi:agmatine deiminase
MMTLRNLVLLFLLLLNCFAVYADTATLEQNPHLGHYLDFEEIGRLPEREFYETDPPAFARSIAEFQPMEAVLIRYPLGISYSLIASFAEQDKVITIVSSQSQMNSVSSVYASQGINLSNCDFLIAASNSHWTRDYGPWYIYDGYEVAIVNFIYNRPRPSDNDIPIYMADYLNIPLYGMPLVQTGGNYMTDGGGIAASSDLVHTENSQLSPEEIDELMLDFLGIQQYHVLPDPNNTYIDHIDCWGKFLGEDKVLIREVPAGHAQYVEIEAAAAYFASQNCAWGYPYEVYRVYTPNDQPYTNSLILNKRVFVPLTGSSYDNAALAAYQAAMPGYEILGVSGNWYSTDALHCRTKGVADRNMVQLSHQPFWQVQDGGGTLSIDADLIACSGEEFPPDSVYVAWKFESEEWTISYMQHAGETAWQTSLQLPYTAGEFSYYIHAADALGNFTDHPVSARDDAHRFLVMQAIAYGDLDENNAVEPYDAAILMRYIVGQDPLPELDPIPWEDARIIAADLDDNGELDSYDVSLILQYFVGIITEFPVQR